MLCFLNEHKAKITFLRLFNARDGFPQITAEKPTATKYFTIETSLFQHAFLTVYATGIHRLASNM
jgi:hypothetical protein